MNLITFTKRVVPKIDRQADGCWAWAGTVSAHGYGRIMVDLTTYVTHRLVYEMFLGPIPEGQHLHHKCGVRHCCNPLHLEPVTAREHGVEHRTLDHEALAGQALSPRTNGLCRKGHPLTEENSYVRKNPDGTFRDRQCRTCRAARRTV